MVFESCLDDGFGGTDIKINAKLFKPTISDLKLLIGTKEWPLIKIEHCIDENTKVGVVLLGDLSTKLVGVGSS